MGIAIALSAGIILTTIHTQDYKDILGDAATGRVTLPIAYPVLSRIATAFVLTVWSWGVSRTWRLDDVMAAVMGILALIVGVSFVTRTGARADKVSFYWYNVSSSPSHPWTAILMCLTGAVARFGFARYLCFQVITGCAWCRDQTVYESGPIDRFGTEVLMDSWIDHVLLTTLLILIFAGTMRPTARTSHYEFCEWRFFGKYV
jgi:hypothetical protein